jgi:hypothetical protein
MNYVRVKKYLMRKRPIRGLLDLELKLSNYKKLLLGV